MIFLRVGVFELVSKYSIKYLLRTKSLIRKSQVPGLMAVKDCLPVQSEIDQLIPEPNI